MYTYYPKEIDNTKYLRYDYPRSIFNNRGTRSSTFIKKNYLYILYFRII